MSYRVLIPAAGTGSRLGNMTRFLNKSLVSISHKPALSRIIEQFPEDAEFVIALGHKGSLIREFLSLAYPKRTFFFADVYPFEGPGSGLGLSILSCRQYLRQPFIFISCDTLVREPIPNADHNWMGYADHPDTGEYRTIEIASDNVLNIREKRNGNSEAHKPYIGLSGIYDYKMFWDSMENGGDDAISTGEAHGLRSLLRNGIKSYGFTWLDTGNPEALSRTREAYKQPDEPNILEKEDEAIWFIGNRVVKFSDNEKFISNRVLRAKELKEFVPEMTGSTVHMYSYIKTEGDVLSKVVTLPLFRDLLDFSKSFWELRNPDSEEKTGFNKACMKFYRDKTRERVEMFYKKFDKTDGSEPVNDTKVPMLKEMLDSLDWNWIAEGIPCRYHGDFHFENIIYSGKNRRFTFLDWRQDFGGSLTIGDLYYDLAKLLHGLIICHELIADDLFRIDWTKNEIRFDFLRKQILVECERYFSGWVSANGYDRKKVWVLTALVFLNIAALHHYPYGLLLYALGKKILSGEMYDRNI
jgi:NDP-sugar pyrophosphorylase family protein